jgi:hypothetical protein
MQWRPSKNSGGCSNISPLTNGLPKFLRETVPLKERRSRRVPVMTPGRWLARCRQETSMVIQLNLEAVAFFAALGAWAVVFGFTLVAFWPWIGGPR